MSTPGRPPQRIHICGSSGAGKSTLAQELQKRLNVEWVELDSLWHMPNWTTRPRDEFQAMLRERLNAPAWVVGGFYSKNWHIIWPLTDTIVWLDYPKRTVFWRLFCRCLVRGAQRQELWQGNRESLWTHFFTKDSLLLFLLKTHGPRQQELAEAVAKFGPGDPQVLHFRSPRETERWLQSL